MRQLVFGSDHAGFELKTFLVKQLNSAEYELTDIGVHSTERVDYPQPVAAMVEALRRDPNRRGIIICGTGIGVSIAANRYEDIRAALCVTPEMAEMARRHNDSNLLCLGGRLTDQQTALDILNTWLSTDFEGGRHQRRLDMIPSGCA